MNKRRMIELIVFLLIMLGICVSVMIVNAFANSLEERKDNSNVVIEETNYIIDQFGDEVEISQPYEDPHESEKIEAALDWHYIEDVTLTAYCSCVECCGKSDGITATGTQAQQGVTIAVDTDVIPLGAWVEIEIDGELHQYHAEDTGCAVVGNHIDIYFDSHEMASAFGVKTRDVLWYGGADNGME